MSAMAAHIMSAGPLEEAHPAIINRKTKGGRSLQYRLRVLQQPERARACGSGSKSAADRRPVDPPPVVELRIFETGPDQDAKDITFHYNANFFLFATLELARPLAHGRVQTPAATSSPVLTGMPVSGMAYLDRPSEAGYFLFPDLSVRHEGRYRLSFNLYEETKEDKDFDVEVSDSKRTPMAASFDWRMEIKSIAFSVFSAKKFPGLSESTALSRTVAEQGCRVRIRRDVRMRRRDGKPSGGDYKKPDEDYGHRPTARTPERQPPHDYRQRSTSAASDHSRHPYAQDVQRRPSMADAYHPPPPPPPPGYSQNVGGSHHLGFGSASSHPQQYPAAQPPPASPTVGYNSSTHHSPYQPPHGQHYGYGNRHHSSHAYGPAKSGFEERRLSGASHVAPSPSPQYPPAMLSNGDDKIEVDTRVDRRMSQSYPSAPIVPASPVRPEAKSKGDVRLPSLTELINTPMSMPASMRNIEADPDPSPMPPALSAVPTGSKRPLEEPSYSVPLYNGERPKESDADVDYIQYDGLRLRNAGGYWRSFRENKFDASS